MYAARQQPTNGLAIAAMVLGILSLVFFCVQYVAMPCGILAVVFGIIGRNKARMGASGGGMATAGLVCGGITVALYIVMVLAAVACGTALLTTFGGIEGLEQFLDEAARQAEQSGATTAPSQ
jgi:hypothetical protein